MGPQGSSAWGTISTQLSAEGADQPTIAAAQNTFTTAWNNLSTTFGMDADSALTGAQQYTFAASTLTGAVSTVQGLVGGARSMATPAGALSAINMFTGSMVGIAVAAGAASAGVGAVIVAAVAIAGEVLQSILGEPAGVEVCPGVSCNPAPKWVIQCVCCYGNAYSPGQNGWRPFPTDSAWFTQGATAILKDGYTGETTAVVYGQENTNPNFPWPIQQLFPEYMSVVYVVPSAALFPFHSAFVAAWKANKEYALNGQKCQDDETVLQHTVLLWNRAHSNSSTVMLGPTTPGYMGSIVQNAISKASSALQKINSISGNSFVINTGPQKTFAVTLPEVLTLHIPKAPTAPASSTTSAGKTAVGVTAAAVSTVTLTAIVWSLATGKAWDWAFGQAWEEIKDVFDKGGPATFLGELRESNPVGERSGSATQTLLFSRRKYTTGSAKAWARAHGYHSGKVDVTSNYIRLRQQDPSRFSRLRTVTFSKDIKAVIGFKR